MRTCNQQRDNANHLPRRVFDELAKVDNKPKFKNKARTGSISGLVAVEIPEAKLTIFVPPDKVEVARERYMEKLNQNHPNLYNI
jgi:hypothetical protein